MTYPKKPIKLDGVAKPKKLSDHDEVRKIITQMVRDAEGGISESIDSKHRELQKMSDSVMDIIHSHALFTQKLNNFDNRIKVYNELPWYKKLFNTI